MHQNETVQGTNAKLHPYEGSKELIFNLCFHTQKDIKNSTQGEGEKGASSLAKVPAWHCRARQLWPTEEATRGSKVSRTLIAVAATASTDNPTIHSCPGHAAHAVNLSKDVRG